jgi:hypothetical protein
MNEIDHGLSLIAASFTPRRNLDRPSCDDQRQILEVIEVRQSIGSIHQDRKIND